MPLDPGLSLDVAGGGGSPSGQIPLAAGGAAANPFSSLGSMLSTANQLNQLKLFQQQFNARQQAGQIIAAAPDIDSAMEGLQKSGVAGYLVPEMQAIREMQRTQTAIAGEQLTQNQSAFHAVLRSTLTAKDPDDFDTKLGINLATLPKDVLQRNLPAILQYRRAVLDGGPAKFQQNIMGLIPGAGLGPEELHSMFGVSGQIDQGNQIQPVMTNQITGLPVPIGPAYSKGSPAQMGTIGNVPVPLPAVSGGGQMQGGGGAAGGGAAGPAANPLAAPQGAGGGTAGAASASPPPLLSSLGLPMEIGTAPYAAKGALGLNVMSPAQAQQNEQLVKDYTGEAKSRYDAANESLGSLNTLDKAADNLVASGGRFLTPGALAETRLAFAKTANTLAQIIGKPVPFDAEKVATGEDFNKVAGQLVAAATKQSYGASHVAAETVSNVAQTVPQLSNSYLGGKLLIAGLQQTANRILDQRAFEQAWMDKNQGSLINADNEFNKQFPAKLYSDKALQQFGMNEQGFATPEAIGKAYASGLLTRAQAQTIGKAQFPNLDW